MVLLLLERITDILANTSALARQAPVDLRSDLVSFEHDAAMAKTAQAMSRTPAEVLKASASAAELVEHLTIVNQGDNFRVEMRGIAGGGTASETGRAPAHSANAA